MHQLILITAMSATTGLFGGKHCGGKVHHGRAASGCSSAAYPAPAPCGWSGTQAMPYTSAPAGYPGSPQMAPAKAPVPASTPDAPSVPTAPSVPAAPAVPAPPPPNSASYAPGGPTSSYQAVNGPAWTRWARRATR